MTVPPPDGLPPDVPLPSSGPPPAVSIRFVLRGILLAIPISFVLFMALEQLRLPTPGVGITFSVLLFVVAGGMCFIPTPQYRGLGTGLMTGWAILSIVSGGVCTGFTRFLL